MYDCAHSIYLFEAMDECIGLRFSRAGVSARAASPSYSSAVATRSNAPYRGWRDPGGMVDRSITGEDLIAELDRLDGAPLWQRTGIGLWCDGRLGGLQLVPEQ